ncbi:unnamed protein product, partial [Hapterophycus canaliculatus]
LLLLLLLLIFVLAGRREGRRCLTMLIFVTSLWVTEATPYFVTALMIPVLVVLMDIMENSHGGEVVAAA